MSTLQSGEFIMRDGVITKVPGKKFEYPEMPAELLLPNPPSSDNVNPYDYQRRVDDVGQMNHLRKYTYRREARRQYNTLRRLYYIQETRRAFMRIKNRMASFFLLRSNTNAQ